MKLCLISPSDIIISKLKHLFQREVKVVRATRSGDLFDLEDQMDGDELH